ncbi:Transcriptional regulator MraZ [Koleobacter methoxysyntrophicus]|uniref:Transcriptional regulator MraZ n=2 Tax=Koleobacter methoxysyntrophicus TaxID=2751313 RepID=A0A8A0RQ95_9FIRM|nr:transcriptional regulator MraZ [Thermosediminibacterales bacterium]QSQ09728.1 Transcriptional regulator MraZ [Koleobacter methoxysyntrophicus]
MGEYNHTVDSKGRLIIPAKFRELLGEKFVITKGLDHCLFVYPMDEWANLERKLKDLPFTQKDARAFVRFFFSGATEIELDKQGRVLIPPNLREFAKIEKDVVIIGVSSRVEIWSLDEWQSYSSSAEVSYEEIAEKMVELGI